MVTHEEIHKTISELSNKPVGEAFRNGNMSFYFALILYWMYKEDGAAVIVDRNRNKFACMIRGIIYDSKGEVKGDYDWQFYTLY